MTAKRDTPSLSELTDKNKDAYKDREDHVHTDVVDKNRSDADQAVVDSDPDKDEVTGLSKSVVATVPNKTPSELAAESADEAAARYGVDTSITKEDADNPRVQVYEDTRVYQVPSGTHLHPDVAKDLQNRGISSHTTDSAQVSRTISHEYDFAPDAENNDKF